MTGAYAKKLVGPDDPTSDGDKWTLSLSSAGSSLLAEESHTLSSDTDWGDIAADLDDGNTIDTPQGVTDTFAAFEDDGVLLVIGTADFTPSLLIELGNEASSLLGAVTLTLPSVLYANDIWNVDVPGGSSADAQRRGEFFRQPRCPAQ